MSVHFFFLSLHMKGSFVAVINENNSLSMFGKLPIKHREKKEEGCCYKNSCKLIHPHKTTLKARANGFSVALSFPFRSNKCNLS